MKKDAAIDKEAAGTLRALRRAARRARELAEKTGTPFYVMKNNRIVDLNPRSLRQSRSKSSQKRCAA
jgi:diaminopimelate decarboxylase